MTKAKTVDELRAAQAVVLPLEYGLSLVQTAQIVGRSAGWVARQRRRYIRGELDFSSPAGWGGRRNELMTEQEELALVRQGVVNGAYSFTKSVRDEIKKLLDRKLNRPDNPVAESTLNAIMLRVARKTIPGGTPTDLQGFSAPLTEKWLKERRLQGKKRG